MKKLLFVLVVGFVSFSVSAQSDTYHVGTNVISGGIGLGSSLGGGYAYGTQSPALSLQYERGLWEAGPGIVSLGGYIGTKTYKFSNGPDNSSLDYTVVGARGAWHYTGLAVDRLDLYGGLMLAYDAASYSSNYGVGGTYNNGLSLTVFVGGRYYFANQLGAFLELGYGVADVNVGLSVKF
jgi:hypothetical protein